MRLGETGTIRLEVKKDDPFDHARETLRALGLAPVHAGHYRIVITKITAQQHWEEAYEEVEAERAADGKEMA